MEHLQEQLQPPEGEGVVMRLLRAPWETPEGKDTTFTNTGGGCMAVEIRGEDWELLATDLNGPFTRHNLDTDDDLTGRCVGRSYMDAGGDWIQQEEPLFWSEDLDDIDAVVAVMRANARRP